MKTSNIKVNILEIAAILLILAGFFSSCSDKKGNEEVDETVAVSGVELSRNECKLEFDEFFTLSATVAPSDATNQKLSWTIEEGGEAYISIEPAPDGMSVNVTAKAVEGETAVIATTEDGTKTARCIVKKSFKKQVYR